MAKSRAAGRPGKKDPLGKELLHYGGVDPASLAVAIALVVVGVGLAGVTVLRGAAVYPLLGGVGLAATGAVGAVVARGLGGTLEVRAEGVRYTARAGVTELTWAEVRRVDVRKEFNGGAVVQSTNLDDESRTYRGTGITYHLTFVGEDDRIVVPAAVLRRGPGTQTLLRKLENVVPGDRFRVYEPNDDHVYSPEYDQ